MAPRIKVLEIELSRPLRDISGLDGYTNLLALLRWQGVPLGQIDVPVKNDGCSASVLRAEITRAHKKNILKAKLRQCLDQPIKENSAQEISRFSPDTNVIGSADDPLVTVVVCTRDRTRQLQDCLCSLSKLIYRNIEVLVVDNAPVTNETKKLMQSTFPAFRYMVEPRPGLDWARNCAIEHANGEIIAYTDDDVVVDPLWIKALVDVFVDDSAVMAVTGNVLAYELETQAQINFERNGGFGRGFKRQWYKVDKLSSTQRSFHIGAGKFGTGANMAYRRKVFEQIGGFDPALDVGTVTNGGGDLEMFFRVLEEGYTLVYEPVAVVWHRHRKTFEELRTQLTNNGVGLYSYFVRSAKAYPHHRWAIFRFGLWWFWHWNVRRLLKSFIVTLRVPRALILAELRGSLSGLTRYALAKRRAKEIEVEFADEHHTSLRGNLKLTQSV